MRYVRAVGCAACGSLAIVLCIGTALAAPCLDESEIAHLTEINDEMAAAMAELDSLRFGRLNQEFHGLIYEHCPNAALVGMLRDVARRLDAIRRTVFVQIPYRGAASVSEHRELIELIASRAPAPRLRLTPTSTPSAVESMKPVCERSTTNRLLPSSPASRSAHFSCGAVVKSSSPSTDTTLVCASSLRR